ncbi:MAG TPA: chemotaxis-specific protein-glutamate methyltransferase CheB [Burkholderiaceae bacterium]
MPASIRAVVVDDSALMRSLVSALLESAGDIRVVGTAGDPYAARRIIKRLDPDVLTLDVEMPRMDGLAFLANLMRLRPMPVVMLAAATARGSQAARRALALGAVDCVAKPGSADAAGLDAVAEELITKVRAAARDRRPRPLHAPRRGVIALGASTGGTEAIRTILAALPADAPAVLVVQHIPAGFSRAFAERLDRASAMRVGEARDGEALVAGRVYLAPGNHHLCVAKRGGQLRCRLDDGPLRNRHRPSVDTLFDSVARAAGAACAAALLTGMGEDGAEGLLALRRVGATTLAQDRATSVVWGMPAAALRLGAAGETLPLAAIAPALLRAFNGPRHASSTAAAGRSMNGWDFT